MAANFTACLSRTRSLLFCEISLHQQLRILGFGIFDLGAQPAARLARTRPIARPEVSQLLSHLVPSSPVYLTSSHVHRYCVRPRLSIVVNDKGNRFCLVLLGKATACRTHSFFSRLIRAANPCVHQTGNAQCRPSGRGIRVWGVGRSSCLRVRLPRRSSWTDSSAVAAGALAGSDRANRVR